MRNTLVCFSTSEFLTYIDHLMSILYIKLRKLVNSRKVSSFWVKNLGHVTVSKERVQVIIVEDGWVAGFLRRNLQKPPLLLNQIRQNQQNQSHEPLGKNDDSKDLTPHKIFLDNSIKVQF